MFSIKTSAILFRDIRITGDEHRGLQRKINLTSSDKSFIKAFMTAELVRYPVIAKNLSFRAGLKYIVKDVSLVLEKNEFVGMIGGSGSGKTTLLTCLNGFRSLSEGRLLLNGVPSGNMEKVRSMIGYVPQEDIVHRTLTVERVLYYSYLLRVGDSGGPDKTDYTVKKILYYLDLTEHKNKKVSSLSGGQRKRVNIGVELLHSPPLFFLDEPTAGLDPGLERHLMRMLAKMARQNRLIVLTTHLMQNVSLFDVLIFVHKGRMIYCGPGDTIAAHFKVDDMVDLFEKIMKIDPEKLHLHFLRSDVFHQFLAPRLKECANV